MILSDPQTKIGYGTSSVHLTRTARIWLDEVGIVRTVVLPNANIVLEDTVRNYEVVKELSQGQRVPMYTDARAVGSASRDVRVYASSDFVVKLVSATAVLVGSPVSRVLGNFFVRLNRPPYPTRLFTDEAEALDWLKQFV